MKSGKCAVGRASGKPRPMNGKTTLFPRNDGGEQIESLYFQSRNAIERIAFEKGVGSNKKGRNAKALRPRKDRQTKRVSFPA
ncbi:hypothetical protein [uncultured Desulfovibrio sp.]|nr:hypothetical protein [uncultured Desulfovibrio sp.]